MKAASGRRSLQCRSLVLALLSTAAKSISAQETMVADVLTCRRCSIVLEHRSGLYTTAAGRAGVPLQVVPLADGRIVVRLANELPALFSNDGRYLREIGRRGAGPGEFEGVADVARLPGDSLLVLDPDLGRASVFGPDIKFVRSVALPSYATALAVLDWPRVVVVNGVSHAQDRAGWPLHFMDFASSPARLESSFGDNNAELRAGGDFALIRRFFEVSSKSFWTYHITKYQLTRYSRDGQVEATVRRAPAWFARESPWSIGGPTMAPPPILQAAAVRGDTLWVAVAIPRPDWQRAWRSDRIIGKRELTRADKPGLPDLYRTRFEVIDLRRGTLVAQQDVDGLVLSIDHRLSAVFYSLNRDLEPQVRYVDLRLTR